MSWALTWAWAGSSQRLVNSSGSVVQVVELAGPAGAVVGELVARGDEDFLADDGFAGVAFDADAFDDDGVAVDVGFPLQQGGEGAAFHAGEGRGAGEVDDGGDQVKVGHRAVVDAVVGDLGSGPEHRHADDGLVGHGGFSALAVVVDHFAVV